MREYSFHNLTGCVQRTKTRQTGTLVGVYHGVQSGGDRESANGARGGESDPPIPSLRGAQTRGPWVTVCEVHDNLVCHPTLALAKAHAADPAGWCEDCRHYLDTKHMLREEPMPCTGCKRVAYVGAPERMQGHWTCYGCGLSNPTRPADHVGGHATNRIGTPTITKELPRV